MSLPRDRGRDQHRTPRLTSKTGSDGIRWFRSRRPLRPAEATIEEIVVRNVAIGSRLDRNGTDALIGLTGDLIEEKRWEPLDGLELSDEVLVTIAANAAIPVLAIGPGVYRDVAAIIVHPGSRTSTGPRAGPASGVVADQPIAVIGEAAAHAGPLTISWRAALAESRTPAGGRNVVIHEFAHKIDMRDGYTDGVPPLRGQALDRWVTVLDAEYGRSTSDPSDSVLRPYAWSSPAEFFAVSTEVFFCTPGVLAEAKPVLYGALADFYRQDPAAGR